METKSDVSTLERMTKEGNTWLVVPDNEEPDKFPVFFNPKGGFVREVSIICYKAHLGSIPREKEITFADSLAGVGARGLRVANEIEEVDRVFLNDINSRALDLGRKSAKLNSIEEKCVFSRHESCSFLLSRNENEEERFDVTDVDPFGTPSNFVDCAIRSVKDGGLLSLTATDSAVLCGVYPKVALRKYLGFPLRTEYSHEVGLRLLFGLVAQTAMRLEAGIEPIFCHHDMHYFRVYAKIKVGNPFSRANEENIGFIQHCFVCGYHLIVPRNQLLMERESYKTRRIEGENRKTSGIANDCPTCRKDGRIGRRLAIAGPLWIGEIKSNDFERRCRAISDLPLFNDELSIPLYYDVNNIKLSRGMSMPKINLIVENLRSRGFLASRTRLNPNAVRSDATREALRDVVLELAH